MPRPPSRPLPGMHALAAAGRPKVRRGGAGRSIDKSLEDQLCFEIRAFKLPAPEREYRFHPTRKWRFDLAWPERLLAVEVEGGGFVQGRHGRGVGMEKDCEKYSEAAIAGWRVLRVTGGMVKRGEAIRFVWRALGGTSAYLPPPAG